MKLLVAWLAGLALAAALVLGACSDKVLQDGPTPTATTPSTTTPGATATVPASTPAALSPGLQKILADVASVRELEPPPTLEVHLIERSKLSALLDSLLTDEDREWFRNTTTLYRLLGHLRDDQDYESIYESFGSESVLGLYSPLDDALWIVHDDGETLDLDNLPPAHKTTLAHEFVHAIQDYHFKLDEIYSRTVDNLDWGIAYTSAVEGDAVIHERAYTRKFGFRIGAGPVLFAAGRLAATQDVPPSIVRELLFPYTTGVDWVAEIKRQGGIEKVNDIIEDPPHGSAYVIHPELLANGFEPVQVSLPDLSRALGDGWERQSGGQFGEFQLRNYLQLRVRAGVASDAAAGWQGDHYDVYVDGDESVAAFRLTFAGDDEAREFEEAQQSWLDAAGADPGESEGVTYYETSNGNVTAVAARNGSDLVFVIASDRNTAENAIEALLKG